MKGLEIAIKSYKTEYIRLPEVASSDTSVIESKGRLLAILLAEDTAKNPREIRFIDLPPAKVNGAGGSKNAAGDWELRDPWGNFYRIQLDVDDDGKIPNPAKSFSDDEPAEWTTDVIIYSAGPDGDFSTWADNVCSWK